MVSAYVDNAAIHFNNYRIYRQFIKRAACERNHDRWPLSKRSVRGAVPALDISRHCPSPRDQENSTSSSFEHFCQAQMVSDITSLFPKDQVLTPEDGQTYEDSLRRWAENAERRAKYVVFPKSSEDIAKAVRCLPRLLFSSLTIAKIMFARANGLELAIKGGGHSASGASSSEDMVIDLGRSMNNVAIDVGKQLITVGGGALWYDVDVEAAKYGLATVGGTVNHTGTLFHSYLVDLVVPI